MKEKKLPSECPSCEHRIAIERLSCARCGTAVEGHFSLPRLARLTPAEQRFLELFLLASGNLKEVGKRLDLSYPTVRKRLDALVARVAEEVERDQAPREDMPGEGEGS